MEPDIKKLISKELEHFHCSILLEEIREKIHKLKDYGLEDKEIMSVMSEKDLFPQLIVTKDYKIILSGQTRVEVVMEPLIKAVYMLFLSHPEGIILKHLPDYEQELRAIYLSLRPKGLTERVGRSILDVTNPMLNSINEKCARIRRIFMDLLPHRIANYYAITGKRGEVKKIELVQSKVVWECIPFLKNK